MNWLIEGRSMGVSYIHSQWVIGFNHGPTTVCSTWILDKWFEPDTIGHTFASIHQSGSQSKCIIKAEIQPQDHHSISCIKSMILLHCMHHDCLQSCQPPTVHAHWVLGQNHYFKTTLFHSSHRILKHESKNCYFKVK